MGASLPGVMLGLCFRRPAPLSYCLSLWSAYTRLLFDKSRRAADQSISSHWRSGTVGKHLITTLSLTALHVLDDWDNLVLVIIKYLSQFFQSASYLTYSFPLF